MRRESGKSRLGGPEPSWLLPAAAALMLAVMLSSGCVSQERVPIEGQEGFWKSSSAVRAQRRAFDGAPPVIGHEDLGAACQACHHQDGLFVSGLGYAPPSPHAGADGVRSDSRCQQCHVFQRSEDLFVRSNFQGLAQDLRRGRRDYAGAPPVIPHQLLMRRDCLACHSGPAAREAIRTSHPERERCRQCHVPAHTDEEFVRHKPVRAD